MGGHVTVPADKLGWYTGPAILSGRVCAHLCKVHLSRAAFQDESAAANQVPFVVVREAPAVNSALSLTTLARRAM